MIKQNEYEYMILATINAEDRPNVEVLYYSRTLKDAKEIYTKLLRLNDLQNPETESLKQEYNDLYGELSNNHGINIFGESDIDDIEWDLISIFSTEKVI